MSEPKQINGSHALLDQKPADAGNQPQPKALRTAYSIGMNKVTNKITGEGMVLIKLTFTEPQSLAGQEYASFQLNHTDAGVFARNVLKVRDMLKTHERDVKAAKKAAQS
jgi:hypothetical protein